MLTTAEGDDTCEMDERGDAESTGADVAEAKPDMGAVIERDTVGAKETVPERDAMGDGKNETAGEAVTPRDTEVRWVPAIENSAVAERTLGDTVDVANAVRICGGEGGGKETARRCKSHANKSHRVCD